MAFGRPSFIATALLGPELARRVTALRSETAIYGSTSGPFGGMGGSAMTMFTVTEFRIGSAFIYFADDRFLGWTYDDSTPREQFPNLSEGMTGLSADKTKCPVELPDFALVRYEAAKAAISKALTMGCEAESDDPTTGPIARSITTWQVDWIASWLAGEGFTR